ncbi:MAG TPA: hypothetical protein VGI45_13630 [Terracidiphilus sp.]
MKRTLVTVTLAALMGLGFVSHASAQANQIVVTVPFDFAVGSRTLPQGTYRIGRDGDFLAFRNAEQKTALFTSGLPGESSKDGTSKLIFDNLDGSYFLRKIVTLSQTSSVDFPQSGSESKARESRSVYASSGR